MDEGLGWCAESLFSGVKVLLSSFGGVKTWTGVLNQFALVCWITVCFVAWFRLVCFMKSFVVVSGWDLGLPTTLGPF